MQSSAVVVKGLVQGVFFRKYTCEAALKFNLKGFVRNEPDGSVYMELTGESDNIKMMITWCYTGSPDSVVESVQVTPIAVKQFNDFRISY